MDWGVVFVTWQQLSWWRHMQNRQKTQVKSLHRQLGQKLTVDCHFCGAETFLLSNMSRITSSYYDLTNPWKSRKEMFWTFFSLLPVLLPPCFLFNSSGNGVLFWALLELWKSAAPKRKQLCRWHGYGSKQMLRSARISNRNPSMHPNRHRKTFWKTLQNRKKNFKSTQRKTQYEENYCNRLPTL